MNDNFKRRIENLKNRREEAIAEKTALETVGESTDFQQSRIDGISNEIEALLIECLDTTKNKRNEIIAAIRAFKIAREQAAPLLQPLVVQLNADITSLTNQLCWEQSQI